MKRLQSTIFAIALCFAFASANAAQVVNKPKAPNLFALTQGKSACVTVATQFFRALYQYQDYLRFNLDQEAKADIFNSYLLFFDNLAYTRPPWSAGYGYDGVKDIVTNISYADCTVLNNNYPESITGPLKQKLTEILSSYQTAPKTIPEQYYLRCTHSTADNKDKTKWSCVIDTSQF